MLSRAAVRTCLALALMAAGPALTPVLLAQAADDKPTPPPEPPAPPAPPAARAPSTPPPAKRAPAARTPTPPQAATPAPPPPPAPPPGPPPPRRGRPINVRIDVKITDLRGTQVAAAKSVSLTVADGQNGSARTTVEAPYGKTDSIRSAYLKVDARPDIDITESQRLNLRLSLDYNFIDPADGVKPPTTTTVQESVSLLLESGQPLIVAESADPAGDRRVRLEVTGTILK